MHISLTTTSRISKKYVLRHCLARKLFAELGCLSVLQTGVCICLQYPACTGSGPVVAALTVYIM